jgi:hypothetical protein
MKLYATITSERATKGQGGNEFIDIKINLYDDDRYHIRITPDKIIFNERGYSDPILERYHKDIVDQEENRLKYIKQKKGKKQKDELCDTCRTGHNGERCQSDTCTCELCKKCAKCNNRTLNKDGDCLYCADHK